MDGTRPPTLAQIVEGLLFLGHEPVTVALVRRAVPNATPPAVAAALDGLSVRYRRQRRAVQVVLTPAGAVLGLTDDARRLLAAHRRGRGGKGGAVLDVAPPLPPGALAALATVAYRQPVKEDDVAALLQQDVGPGVRLLHRRGWIRLDRKGFLSTTPAFLEAFALADPNDLPRPAEAA